MKCTKCQYENPTEAKFCMECGAKLENVCSQCGTKLPQEAKFCMECGAKVGEVKEAKEAAVSDDAVPKLEHLHAQLQNLIPDALAQKYLTAEQQATGENRLITALFADISGFTRLSAAQSSEAIFQLVQDCFKQLVSIVANYEGSISGFRGDGLLALFGAPILHENDAERAILAAIDMRNTMQNHQLEVSIGVNTALMTVGEIQTQLHSEYTAYGTDIILAARLQEVAQPGQILVGAGTHRLTRRAFDFETLHSLQLKNISEAVTAYAVQQMKVHPEKLRGIEGLRARMIGREHEFAQLTEATDQWLAEQGQIVSIIGEAGIGKSRLVTELKAYLDTPPAVIARSEATKQSGDGTQRQFQWFEGRCISIGQPISYWPFLDILRTYFNLSEENSGQEMARKVTECITTLFPQNADEFLPFFGNLLSIKFGNDLDERLKFAEPEQIRHQTLMRLRDFFETLAKKQPLLLILEDLHWADDLSLDLLALLMDELATTPIMLLCVYRPEKEHRIWQLSNQAQRKCLDRFTEITLKQLSSRESRQLVEMLLTIDNLPESVKEMILQKSEGNPFFIEEVIRSLIEQDLVYREGDRWKAREEISSIDVPDTIQSVVLARVDRLQTEAKYVLQCASVIGRLFRYRILEHLTEQERNLNQYLSEFEEKDLVYEERTVPELEYAFKHALTQEATYQGILEQRRKEFHLNVAVGIERLYQERLEEYYEELAHHYSKSEDAERAVEYLLLAGEKARRAYLNDEAINYFQRVLEQLDTSGLGESRKEWRLKALKGLGQIYQGIGKASEAEGCFRQAIALGKETGLAVRELVRLYWWLGDVLWWQNRYDEKIRIGEEGLALLGDDTESIEAALMNQTIAVGYEWKGNIEKFREFTYRTSQFIQRLLYSEELRSPYVQIFVMYANTKKIDEALKWLKVLEQKAEQHHDSRALGAVHWYYAAYILARNGDLHNAISHYQRALELFMEIGDAKHGSWCMILMASTLLSLGNLQKAEEFACRGLESAGSIENKREQAWAYVTIGNLSFCQESPEKATGAFRRSQELGWVTAKVSLSLGQAYLAQGKQQEALQQFQELMPSPDTLSSLEEAYDDPEEFRAFCRRFREEHPEVNDSPFVQWYLEPVEATDFPENLFHDEFNESLQSDWTWQDPFDDCSYVVQNGLEIHAANGRDLWHINLSAPRILRSVSGDFAAQTVCVPVSEEKPAIGGFLLWKDKENFLRLDKGTRGAYEISFMGCIGNEDVIIGRGRLPSERIFLRLERIDGRVNALCSADGVKWFTVRNVEFSIEDPVEVGLHAIGNIDRTIHHGAYPEGTAVRFESFGLWGT